jgi:hypothetical protein
MLLLLLLPPQWPWLQLPPLVPMLLLQCSSLHHLVPAAAHPIQSGSDGSLQVASRMVMVFEESTELLANNAKKNI